MFVFSRMKFLLTEIINALIIYSTAYNLTDNLDILSFMKKIFSNTKNNFFITIVILGVVFMLTFAGGSKDEKNPTPTNCDQTTEMDATLFFGAGNGMLPFQYPSAYAGCGLYGPYFSPHQSYNSVTNQSQLSSAGGFSNYYCTILVTAICNAGSTYTRQYFWQAGTTMTIKILQKTPVTIEVKYIDAPNTCNYTGTPRRTIWFGSYSNDNTGIQNQIVVTPTWSGLYQ